jgi:hypothetical protein
MEALVLLMMREKTVIKCEFEMAGEAHPRAWSDGSVSEAAVPYSSQLTEIYMKLLASPPFTLSVRFILLVYEDIKMDVKGDDIRMWTGFCSCEEIQ